MTPQTLKLIWFTLMGCAGGVAYVLVHADGWKSFTSFKSIRHLMVSLIVGFLYYHLYSEWDFPNQIMSFVSAYMGPSFLEDLISKYKREKNGVTH